MNFVAIDFETANEKRSSPCALGIVVVKNGKIQCEKYYLIKPKELRFEPMNIRIHGIRPCDVENEKEFDVLWNEIKPYLENNLVIAHNAAFDMSVLRKTLDSYNLDYPNFNYCCTMVMSKKFYPYLENAKLNTVNNYLGYEFRHHDAMADARACANILLNIKEDIKVNSMDHLLKLIGIGVGEVYKGGYKVPINIKGDFKISKCNKDFKKDDIIVNNQVLKNEAVVFTGPLDTMTRSKAMKLVTQLGGECKSSVSKKVTMLVVGYKDFNKLSIDEMSGKLRRTIVLIKEGCKIKILTEQEFLTLIK